MNSLGARSFLQKYPVEIIFTLLYISMAAVLNLQFLEGSNINTVIAGHDEYIAVKEVYSILNPLSWKHFVLAIIAGDVIFYGRIMFYTDALLAWIPFKIWGVTGMVYAVRMVHSMCVLAGLIILANTFLKDKLHKALFYISSGAVIYSVYFIMMPKPEPMQLLVLALFLYFFRKNDWSFGRHFILLGIAFGLKFNVLLLLPFVFLIPFLKRGIPVRGKNLIGAIKSMGFFLGGLAIAIPCLLLSPLKPIYIQSYLHETFGGTGKSYDDMSITVFVWLKQGFGGHYLGHWVMGYLFLLCILTAFIIQLRKMKYEGDISPTVLLLFGLVMTGVIMFTAKRIWPHYLWTGFIFMFLGFVAFIAKQASTFYKKAGTILVILFSAVSFFYFCTRDLPLYASLDNDPVVRKDLTEGKAAIDHIRKQYSKVHVVTDGTILFPFSDFVKASPYHPFASELPVPSETLFNWGGDHPEKIWDQPAELVVFYKRSPKRMLKENPNVYVGQHEALYALYLEQTKENFIQDTILGEVEIYKRRNK
jgi:Ca2+/Na+ antiporter